MKNNKIPRNKPTLGGKSPAIRKLPDTDERNQRQQKQMERFTTFFDWKNQYCENDSTTHRHLQIQCNPYQITNGIFHRNKSKNFTICMEAQKTPNSQSNLGKEKWRWSNQVS